MTTFELTPEQEAFFKVVLMYISNERKSTLIQLLDTDSAKTVTDLVEDFRERYPSADSNYLLKHQIPGVFDKVLSPLELATLEHVPGRIREEEVQAFRLTKVGQEVKLYAGFALEMMARDFDQSIYPVLGTMNSTAERRRPSEAVKLLYIVNEGLVTVEDLIRDESLTGEKQIYDILSKLSGFESGTGNSIPLVEINGPILDDGNKGYHWIKGSSMPTTTRPTERWRKLVELLSSNPDRVWTKKELARKCGYKIAEEDRVEVLGQSLSRLEDKYNIWSGSSHEFRTVHITPHGRRLIYPLFDSIRGAIAGDEISLGIVGRNQPTPESVVSVLGHYIGIKNQERGKSPTTN